MAAGPSLYLSAIKKIVGNTPGEKFHTLNRIAKEIVDKENENDSNVDMKQNIPEVLKPLVQVEIARLSGQFEGICEALKSDDSAVINRALRAKWFFNGSHENCRVEYYQTEIFPVVSLQTRNKIIKALANNLTTKPAIAKEFYAALTLMYEEKRAHPLLKACSESFIWHRITEHKLRLNNGMVRILFEKYPELVVEYLKLSKKSDDEFERNIRPVNLQSHASFLPRLFNEYPDTFVELIEKHDNHFNIILCRRSTDLFIEKFSEALMRNPRTFLPMLDLKVVHKNLTDVQFKANFKYLFPPEIDTFKFDEILKYIEFLPNDEKLPLIISAFEEVYGVKFLDCPEKITTSAILLHPPENRNKIVKVILQAINEDKAICSGTPWICYLTCDDSIKHLTCMIGITDSVVFRLDLITKLILTCRVNHDSESFLIVIEYILAEHRNKLDSILINILHLISTLFPLNTLTRQHWDMLMELILSIKNKFQDWYDKIPLDLITGAVRCDLDNNINDNTRNMELLTECYLNRSKSIWIISTENLQHSRICLEHFITNLLNLKSPNTDSKIDFELAFLLASILQFNEAVTEAKSDVKVILIKEYPELVKKLRSLFSDNIRDDISMRILKVAVKNLDEDLYNAWVSKSVRETENLPNTVIYADLRSKRIWKMLKTDPQYFVYNWEEFLIECREKFVIFGGNDKSCFKYDPLARKFLRMSRWCQDLPIKFIGRLLKDIVKYKKGRDLIALAVLLEGPELQNIAATFNVVEITKLSSGKNFKSMPEIVSCVPRAISLANSPVSLDLILKYCVGNCEREASDCLINVSRRTRVDIVLSFAKNLTIPPVIVRRLRIQLFCMIHDADHLRCILRHLWKFETDYKIRKLLLKKMFKLFESFPDDDNWELINNCIDDLRPGDKYTFKFLMKFDPIPNEFIAEYVHKLFCLFRRLGDEENGLQPGVVRFYITKLLNTDKNILVLFPDGLHHEIIRKYVLDLSLPKEELSAGHNYLINYIVTARNKLEDRLNRFRNIFIKIVNESWDIPHPTEPSFYPANYFVHELIKNIVHFLPNHPIKHRLVFTAVMTAFSLKLKPHQDPEFCSSFIFTSNVNGQVSPKELATKINRFLPAFAASFDYDVLGTIAEYLYEIIDSFIRDVGYQLNVIRSLVDLENCYANSLAVHLLEILKVSNELSTAK